MATLIQGEFADAGYRVVPSFVAADDLPILMEKVEQELSVPPHPGMSRPGNDLLPLRWNNRIVACILQSERCLHMLREVVNATDLKWLSAYVSTKRPHTPALWWHQDWWCWDHPISFCRNAPQVAVLCYLTDIDRNNGALRILPGSHHKSMPIHRELPEPHGSEANTLANDHPALLDIPGQVTIGLRAGDAVVLDYRVLHGTHANSTGCRRDCILLSFIPAWDELPREIKAHLMVHPALPDAIESKSGAVSAYAGILPKFDGEPVSLEINRVPPASFVARDQQV